MSTIPDLTKEMVHHLGDMFRNELKLARTEAVDSAKTLGASLALMGGGLAFGASAITLAGIAIAEIFPPDIPRWLGFLIAAIVAAVVAFLLVKAGQSAMKPKALTLPRTREQVGRDIQAIKEHLPS